MELIFITSLAILLVWNLFLTYNQYRLIYKNKELFGGKKVGDVYDLLNSYLIKMRKIEKQNEEVLSKIESVNIKLKTAFQKIGILRYNPFGNIGGDQSFSLALLDEEDRGVVITSIHGREGNRTYAKPIAKKKSEYNLSKEELEALVLAGNKSDKLSSNNKS